MVNKICFAFEVSCVLSLVNRCIYVIVTTQQLGFQKKLLTSLITSAPQGHKGSQLSSTLLLWIALSYLNNSNTKVQIILGLSFDLFWRNFLGGGWESEIHMVLKAPMLLGGGMKLSTDWDPACINQQVTQAEVTHRGHSTYSATTWRSQSQKTGQSETDQKAKSLSYIFGSDSNGIHISWHQKAAE